MTYKKSVILFFIFLLTTVVHAGNGPHNWLIVYDPGDPHGVAIARYYQEKRGFPDSSMVAYSFPRRAAGSPSIKETISGAEGWAFVQFLRSTITARKLDDQIHGITLVGNAPVAVTTTLPNSRASITTALVISPGTTTQSEWEARTKEDYIKVYRPYVSLTDIGKPAIEIRSDIAYEGKRYWLSTHLGFTGIHGLRPDEVFTLIDRSTWADGKAPQGTIYWPNNSDFARSREDQAIFVLPEWRALGLDSHVYGGLKYKPNGPDAMTPENKTGAPGSYPHTERAVQGAIAGTWGFNLDDKPSLYTPGAIAENMTSFGGVMGGTLGWGQTPCTLWLRAGASGTSGTVTEPTADSGKFPNARIHSHYFSGATLAEAFLMSLRQPWQTLVMGDGLTQPYAKIPSVVLSGINQGQSLSGTITLGVTASGDAGVEANLDLVVDGRVVNIGAQGEPVSVNRVAGGFEINTNTLSDGNHELRVIAYAANAVRSQGFATRRVVVNNTGASVTVAGASTGKWGASIPLTVSITGVPDATSVEVLALGQVLATLTPSGGIAQIPASKLSYHTATPVFAVVKTASGKDISSAPHEIKGEWSVMPAQVEVPTIPDAVAVARIFSADVKAAGFNWNNAVPVAVVPVNDRWAIHAVTGDHWPFLKNPVANGGGVEFITRFYARETGVYDFALQGFGLIGMVVDGVDLIPGVLGGSPIMPSIALAAGWHDLRFRTSVPDWPGTASSWHFQPAFRASYTKRMQSLGWPVVEYEFFTMEHCAAPLTAFTLPRLSGRATAVGAATLNWSNPFGATVTGWKVERHTGDPAVSLVQYLGSATPPTLVSTGQPDALRSAARVGNDHSERFTIVPPFLEGGVRLLTAGADRSAGPSSVLYKVQVPAGTTVYAVFERGNEGNEGLPAWITNQTGWSKISAWDTFQNTLGINISSETTTTWSVYKKSFTAATLLDLGGAGRSVNDPKPTRAITFSFHKDAGVWEEVASVAGSANGTTLVGLNSGQNRLRASAQLPPTVVVPTNELVLDLSTTSSNGAPVVDAGLDLQVAGTTTAIPLNGVLQDDALPAPHTLAATWSKRSGPGTVAFNNATSASTTATFSQPGVYELSLTASDGLLSSDDTVLITVTNDAASNAPPMVNAGADQTILETQSVTLNGSATDDGLPNPPSKLSYQWRLVSGPSIVTFYDSTKSNTKAYFNSPGTYQLELSVSDGAKIGIDTVTYNVSPSPNQAPTVTVPSTSLNAVTGVSINLSASISDDGLPLPAQLTISWEGPGASAVFSSRTSANTSVTFSKIGNYLLRVNAFDGEKTTGQTISVTVTYNDAGNQTPVLTIAQTAETQLGDPLMIPFTATDDNKPDPPGALTYSYEKISGPGAVSFGSYNYSSVDRNAVFSFDQPGYYEIQMTVSDSIRVDSKMIGVTVHNSQRYRHVWGWGRNSNGQIGPFELGTSGMSKPYLIGRGWTEFGGQGTTTFAVKRNGILLGSGKNAYLLDSSGNTNQNFFTGHTGITKVKSVACAGDTTVAVKSDGSVWSWGNSIYGQLGDGTALSRAQPTQIPNFTGAKSVSGGVASSGSFFTVVKEDGTAWAWGRNENGELGLGDASPRTTPTQVQLTGIAQTAQGSAHSLFLKTDGTVWASGRNFDGQLGNGSKLSSLAPVQVLKAPGTPLTSIRKIACGYTFSMALDSEGKVWMWGDNFNGQLGNGISGTDNPFATRITLSSAPTDFLSDIIDIACAHGTAFAVNKNGIVFAWGGSGVNGSLFGSNVGAAYSTRTRPAPIVGLPFVDSIWASQDSAFATTPWKTYDDFVEEYLPESEYPAEQADPNYKFSSGGAKNLLAYALDFDPKLPPSTPPIIGRFDQEQLVFEFEYLATSGDLDISFETSTDLIRWDLAAPASASFLDLGDKEKATLRFNMTPESNKFFLRLKANLKP